LRAPEGGESFDDAATLRLSREEVMKLVGEVEAEKKRAGASERAIPSPFEQSASKLAPGAETMSGSETPGSETMEIASIFEKAAAAESPASAAAPRKKAAPAAAGGGGSDGEFDPASLTPEQVIAAARHYLKRSGE